MLFGLILIACMIGGSCSIEAPLMFGAGPMQVECGTERKAEILNGIGDILANTPPMLQRGDVNALIPIADALRARRVDRLIFRCVEWLPGRLPPPRGRTLGEDTLARDELARRFNR